jgi:class 3 adenylate cyclase
MTSSTTSSGTRVLEIAHVLFVDIVAYSCMPMEEQDQTLRRLQEAVRATSDFKRAQSADELVCLPTGDGMALVFFHDVESPARCALELNQALTAEPAVRVRMGVHSGPVYRVEDINANRNVTGVGINVARRIMDCGGAGHILVSKPVADILLQLSAWTTSLHDLGEMEVKHGTKVHIYDLCTGAIGNSELPQKPRAALKATRVARTWKTRAKHLAASALIVMSAVGTGRTYLGAAKREPAMLSTCHILHRMPRLIHDPDAPSANRPRAGRNGSNATATMISSGPPRLVGKMISTTSAARSVPANSIAWR